MNFRRIFILARFDLLHSIFRLKGLVFLIPYLFYWYCIIWFFIKKGTNFLVSPESIVITSAVFDQDIAQSLLVYNPAAISVFLLLSLSSMPLFVMLAGNDQLSSDSGRKSFRFLLTRCTRVEIFLSRFISSFLLMAILIFFLDIIISIISYYHDEYSLKVIFTYALEVYILVIFYSLPFFAFMCFVSTLMSSAMGTLLMSFILYIGLLIIDYYAEMEFSLLPSGIKQELLLIDSNNLSMIIISLIIYTSVYLLLGWLFFVKRDI